MQESDRLPTLVDKLKRNDMSCFDEFYNLTKREVFFSVYAVLKNRTEAEDIVQETYVKFLEGLEKIDTKRSVRALLCVTARNLAISHLRKHKRLVSVEELVYSEEKLTQEENNSSGLFEDIKKILKESEFELVVLHLVNGFTHKEIAKLTHRPLGTVTWAYNNALKKLKRSLENYEE